VPWAKIGTVTERHIRKIVPARADKISYPQRCFVWVRRNGGSPGEFLGGAVGELSEEATMPVLILWAVPAVIVLGGGTYWLMHLH
jgi:hypothetical protein